MERTEVILNIGCSMRRGHGYISGPAASVELKAPTHPHGTRNEGLRQSRLCRAVLDDMGMWGREGCVYLWPLLGVLLDIDRNEGLVNIGSVDRAGCAAIAKDADNSNDTDHNQRAGNNSRDGSAAHSRA